MEALGWTHFQEPERVPDVVEGTLGVAGMDPPCLPQQSHRPTFGRGRRFVEQRRAGHAQGRAEGMDAARYDRGPVREVIEGVPADLGAPQGFAQSEPTCPRQDANLVARKPHFHQCTII